MTLKSRRKPPITHRRTSVEPGGSGFVMNQFFTPCRLTVWAGLLALCIAPVTLQAGDYPVRQAVFVDSGTRAPVVQTVSHTQSATVNTPVSQSGAELKWIPVHSSQARDVQRPQAVAKPIAEEASVQWRDVQSETVVLVPIPAATRETMPKNPGVRLISAEDAPRRETAIPAFIPVVQTRTYDDYSIPADLERLPEMELPGAEAAAVPAVPTEIAPMEEFSLPTLPPGMDLMESRDSAASPRAIGSPDSYGLDRSGRTDMAPSIPRGMTGELDMLPPRVQPDVLPEGAGILPPGATVESNEDDPWQRFNRPRAVTDNCPSSRDMKPIREITNNIRPSEGIFPELCPLTDDEETYPVRQFAGTQFTWTASNLCHNPLYFEQPDLERYGHSAGPVLQPILSGAQFLLTVPVLPSLIAMEPVNECQYPLGHYRPGSCAPYKWNPVPVSMRSLIAEGGVAAALVFLIP